MGRAAGREAAADPRKALLLVPTEGLGQAIAGEWEAAGETVDPRAMPLTGLANAAIDRVAPDRLAFAAALAKYAEADLACYRAEGPEALAERQAGSWDGLLGWARRRFDIDFVTTTASSTSTSRRRRSSAWRMRSPRSMPSTSPACRRWSPSAARWSPRWRWSRGQRPPRRGTRSASTSAGSSKNGAPTPKPRRRWRAAGRFLRRRQFPEAARPLVLGSGQVADERDQPGLP